MKPKLETISLLVSLSFFSVPLFAASFCSDSHTSKGISGNNIDDSMTLTSSDCYEISSGLDNGVPYNAVGNNFTLEGGSKLSVVGELNTATVESDAYVRISKYASIASNGYTEGAKATATNVTLEKGGHIEVMNGGVLKDSFLSGTVYVVKNAIAGESQHNTVLNGGVLSIYNEGVSFNTIVEQDGVESISAKGVSSGATINSGGRQSVYSEGVSEGATVNDGGFQSIYNQGISKDAIVNSGGKQQLNNSGFSEGTVVNQGGIQYIIDDSVSTNAIINGGSQTVFQSNSEKAPGIAKDTVIKNGGEQIVQDGGQAINSVLSDTAQQYVYKDSSATNTTLNDNSMSWVAVGAKLLGTTTVNQQANVQLTTGAFAEDIILSDPESTLFVVTGNTDNAASIGTLSGQGQVRFAAPNITGYSHLVINNLSGNQTFFMRTAIAEGQGDYVTIHKGSGNHALNVQDSGAEITRPEESRLDLVTDESSKAQFHLKNISGTNINAVDGGTYMYSLYQRDEKGNKIWYLAAQEDDETEPEKPVVPPKPPVVPDNKTTPSTDAVLSMAASPQLIFNNELDNLRFRRGELQNNQTDSSAWIRLTGDKTNVGSNYTHFKLKQAGFELGADKLFELKNSKLWVGVFSGYNDVKLKHQRGGESNIDSITVGGYATLFWDNGLYVDNVVKYNHFNNELRAISTNFSQISGDYSQNAYGASSEVGYSFNLPNAFWTEPYMRLSYMRADSKSIHLNNNMQAKLNAQQSLQSELGLHAGKNFTLSNQAVITPYATLAWQHEFISNNDVIINERNTFNTNFSGNTLKVGGGLTVTLTSSIQAYAELDYRKSSKVESPLHGNLGVKFNF